MSVRVIKYDSFETDDLWGHDGKSIISYSSVDVLQSSDIAGKANITDLTVVKNEQGEQAKKIKALSDSVKSQSISLEQKANATDLSNLKSLVTSNKALHDEEESIRKLFSELNSALKKEFELQNAKQKSNVDSYKKIFSELEVQYKSLQNRLMEGDRKLQEVLLLAQRYSSETLPLLANKEASLQNLLKQAEKELNEVHVLMTKLSKIVPEIESKCRSLENNLLDEIKKGESLVKEIKSLTGYSILNRISSLESKINQLETREEALQKNNKKYKLWLFFTIVVSIIVILIIL